MSDAYELVIRKGVVKSCKGNPCEVVIPEGVTEIGKNAFSGRDELSKVVIPEGVKVIGENAFNECTRLEKVVLPNSLEVIGDGAFFLCPLKDIALPESVTEIGGYAFCNSRVKKVLIPQSVRSIGTRAFEVVSGLANVGMMTDVTILGSEITLGGNVFPKGDRVRFYAPNAPLSLFAAEYKRQIILTYLTCEAECSPERVDEYKKYIDRTDDLIGLLISGRQMEALSKLLQIKSKAKLEKLDVFIERAKGDGEIEAALLAFKERLFKPEDIEKIEERKVSVELGEKSRTVAEWKKIFSFEKTEDGLVITAYKGEEKIVEVPAMIGKDVVVAIGELAFSPFASRNKNTVARRNLKQVILPDTIREIGKGAFKSCQSLQKMVIPEGVTKVGDRAFEGCRGLNEVVIPKSLKVIDRIFEDCINLTRVVIPEGVQRIAWVAFAGCTNLTDVTIAASVTNIDSGAFYRCTKVKIHAPAGSYAETYAKEKNIPFVAE